jgi:hypothetical protein
MSASGLKRGSGGGDAEALRQHDPLRDGEGVAQRGWVLGRAKGEFEQLVGFGYVEEAELGDGGRGEEAGEEGVQRAVGRVADWC